MKGALSRLAYAALAPWLRRWLDGHITGKPLSGTSMTLYYDQGQHLGFFGQRSVRYEQETRDMLADYVVPGCLVFEIGSNIGQLSLWFAERTGPKGRVVCVEPDPENLAFLHFNIRKNRCRHVDILPWAIADKTGKAVFHRDAVTGGRSGTLVGNYALPTGRTEAIDVEIRTYRELLRMYGQPEVVKVDVEGAEDLIFTDSSLLHPACVYFVEVRKETRKSVFDVFSRAGFQALPDHAPGLEVHGPDDIPDFCNLLFIHPERQPRKPGPAKRDNQGTA